MPRTLVMGIVNVTPDSFADGGVRFDPDVAIADAVAMVDAGADLIDIGGESTRPGAPPVPTDEELRRVSPVLEGLRGRVSVPISIDTYKAAVAERALDLGALIVNDISALTYEPELAGVVARRKAAVVLMHNRGRSAEMYSRRGVPSMSRTRSPPSWAIGSVRRSAPALPATRSSSIPGSASRSAPSTRSKRWRISRRWPL